MHKHTLKPHRRAQNEAQCGTVPNVATVVTINIIGTYYCAGRESRELEHVVLNKSRASITVFDR